VATSAGKNRMQAAIELKFKLISIARISSDPDHSYSLPVFLSMLKLTDLRIGG
jgi:hypothetical protein